MPMHVAHSITRVLVPLSYCPWALRILEKEKPYPLHSLESLQGQADYEEQ